MAAPDLGQGAAEPRFTDIFVRRPVLATALCLSLVLIGVRVAIDMPVQQFPTVESASLTVTTPYVGASAETVQGFITDPIERVAATIPGVDFIDSETRAGMSTVTVYLKLNEDSADALAELSTRLGQIRFELPPGAEDPAVEVERADRPYAGWYLGVRLNERMSRAEVTDYLRREVSPQLAAVPGVHKIWLGGGRLPAMRIWLDPERMAMFNVSAQDVVAALTRNNIIATIGQAENANQRVDLLVNTSLTRATEFERMVIRESEGSLIRMRDVARIELGEEEGTVLGRMNHDETVWLGVYPLPGSNEIDVADALYLAVDEINADMPAGLELEIGEDVTVYMRDALVEIFTTLGETILLVGLVVVVMMGSVRTACVPLVTIPISLLGAIAAMSLMGFSLNLLTVLAVVLSVGLVVDDAIVMVENVARHMREGASRTAAALASARQLASPIVAMTMTLAMVYIPIGFLSGLTGVMFKEFAFTLAIAVLISGMVALTLSPVMSSRVAPEQGREAGMTRRVNGVFDDARHGYRRLLDGLLSNNGPVIFCALFFALLAVPFFMFSQKELAPTEDQGEMNIAYTAPPEASLEYTERYMTDVVNAMESLPGSGRMWQMVLTNAGFGGMKFADFDEREQSTRELLTMAFQGLSDVRGLTAFPVLPSALPSAGRFDMEFVVLSSDSAEEMLPHAEALMEGARQTGLFMFVDTDLSIDLPQGRFLLDRDRVADLGMDLAAVSRQLGTFLSGNYVNRFDLDGTAYRVIPMVEREGRPDADALLDLKLRTPDGALVPLSAVARLEETVAPRVLTRFQQKNSFRIRGGLIPGRTKEQGLAAMEELAADLLPGHYDIDYAGESRQLRQEGNTLVGVLGISLAFVFVALAVQFNSFRDPLVVLLGSAPLALSSALLFTYLDLTTINTYTQIGLITLVGLISKNAILIVEFARKLQLAGATKFEAIKSAAAVRLRPVLMTAGATIMGHMPLVFVTGPGAEARNSIGIVLVAGMLLGTLFTLFVLPSIYYLLAGERRSPEAAVAAQPAAALR
ncbi:MAG: efflux RND transporter permease subunit [Gammaproteobacteria bacterium]|nr:efflux RND transporter permease subunit [Gammaproteobacteria bacterium]